MSPTRELCNCGASIELADGVAAPAMTLESWRKSHHHSPVDPNAYPDPDEVKGTLPQVPAGGTYSSHSFGPQHRGVTATASKGFSRTIDLNWRMP